MKENWKTVPSFPYYEASDRGRIRSKDRFRSARRGSRFVKSKIISSCIANAYLVVGLYRNNKRTFRSVHKLVLETFLGPSTLQGNHKDFNKLNNKLSNLEYVTPRENTHHYHKTRKRILPMGVHRNTGKYMATIRIGKKLKYLGNFTTPELAGGAYQKELRKITKPLEKHT